MKILLYSLLIFLNLSNLYAQESSPAINLSSQDCLFVKYAVPQKGIVCSNYERALRLSNKLENSETHKIAWGPFVTTGEYQGESIFIACAPVGTGSGLLFTELFANGANYIIRYGSDDVKKPPESDYRLVKVVDEADNLYGFSLQSGIDLNLCGQKLKASPKIIEALTSTAKQKEISYEMRICHHLENYHALRCPGSFSEERQTKLRAMLSELEKNSEKQSSYDMETAVLFQVAQDFDKHAATILQTVNKEDRNLSSYEGEHYQKALEIEENIFFDYVLESLLKV